MLRLNCTFGILNEQNYKASRIADKLINFRCNLCSGILRTFSLFPVSGSEAPQNKVISNGIKLKEFLFLF